MNDLSGSAAASDRRRCCDPIPSPIPCLLPPLFLSGLAVSVFILVVVRNAFSLAFLLALSALVLGFVLWNLYKFRANGALLLFLDRMPASDLGGARDGQIVKITGFASCGDLVLESSYEKIGRCIYSSTLLYEYRGFGSRTSAANSLCFRWNLTYVERCIADFYVTDVKSGTRVLVKAGSDSKINPVVTESLIVNTTTKNRELSSTLTKWLVEAIFLQNHAFYVLRKDT